MITYYTLYIIRISLVPSKHLVDETSVDKAPGYVRIHKACWGHEFEFAEFADVQCPWMLIYWFSKSDK